MGFHITHRFGVMTSNPPLSAFRALLEEFNELSEDEERCSVSVTHESEWCLGAYGGGYLIWENLACSTPASKATPGVPSISMRATRLMRRRSRRSFALPWR